MFVYLSSHNITVERRIRARITVGKQRGVGVYTQYSTAFGGESLKYQRWITFDYMISENTQ